MIAICDHFQLRHLLAVNGDDQPSIKDFVSTLANYRYNAQDEGTAGGYFSLS